MPKFKRIEKVIEAIQVKKVNLKELEEFTGREVQFSYNNEVDFVKQVNAKGVQFFNGQNYSRVYMGDYLVKDGNTITPVSAKVLEEDYELMK